MIEKEVHKRDNVTFAVTQKDKEKLKGINLHQNPHLNYFHGMQQRSVLGKKNKKAFKNLNFEWNNTKRMLRGEMSKRKVRYFNCNEEGQLKDKFHF